VPTHPLKLASYVVSVRLFRLLQSRFLQTVSRPTRPCGLLIGFGNSPMRDFHPLEKLAIFANWIPMLGTHNVLAAIGGFAFISSLLLEGK